MANPLEYTILNTLKTLSVRKREWLTGRSKKKTKKQKNKKKKPIRIAVSAWSKVGVQLKETHILKK